MNLAKCTETPITNFLASFVEGKKMKLIDYAHQE